MSNVIQFLEAMGKDSTLARFSPDEYAAMVASLDVGDEQRQALLHRDHVGLNDLLGGRQKLYCIVVAPEDEPSRSPDEPDEDDGEEKDGPGRTGHAD